MKRHKIRVKKSVLYNSLFGLGLLTLLAGDSLLSMPGVSPLPRPAGIQINPDDWKSLVEAVSQRADHFNGRVGYIIKDLTTGHVATANADLVFPSASLIKLPILCAAFKAVQEGRLSLSAPVVLGRVDKRGGSGVLKLAPAGSVFTNRELLEYMIGHSDNTAAELLIRQLGYDYLQATFARLGLTDTQIHPDGFRLTSRRVADDNMTSPRDMAFLLEKIYERELVSPEASEQMLEILKHQKLRDRLPRFLPTGWEIAHKTGLLRRACHDVGIVFSPKGDYMICVLTAHQATYKTAKRFIASVGRITYDYYQSGLHTAGDRPPAGVAGGFHRPVMQTRRDTAATSPRAS